MSSRGGGGDRGRGGGGRGGPPRGGPPGGGRGGGGPPRGGARGGPPRGGFGGGGRGGPPGGGSGFAQPAQPLNLPPAVVDPRLADKDINALVAGLSKVKIEGGGGELPVRPGYGTLGKVVKLRANYFPVKKYPSSVFEYSVEMIPGLKPRRLKRRLFELLEKSPQFSEHAPYTANDGSTKLVSVKKLPIEDNESLDIPIKLIDEDDNQASAAKAKTYTLSIKFVVQHDTATLKRYLNGEPGLHNHDAGPVISALNIMFTKHAINTGGINVGQNRYFFAPKGNSSRLELDGNLVAYRGFFLSVRPTFKQLSMNLNVATTAFYKEGNLGEALDIFMRTTLGGNPTAFVKGLRVKTSHLGYTKTVQRVGRQNAKDLTFVHNEYGKISVEAYFKKQYKITLQRPKDTVVDIGSKTKPNWVPPELCHILPNQPYRGKLTGNQTRAMLDIACLPPSINQADIYRNGLPQMGLFPASDSLDKFGMSLGEQMAVVPGRILNPPKVLYGKKEMIIRDSAWNLRDVQFHKGARIGNCLALAINERQGDFGDAADPEFREVMSGFTKMCGASGMNVKDAKWKHDIVRAPPRHMDPGRLRTAKEVRDKVMSLPGRPDLVFIILSNDDKVLYAALKTLLDVSIGVMNVCVISQKIRKEKGQLQYFANVALKVNIKLGGVNHILTGPAMTWLKQKTTMLMGADVTHPSPGSLRGTPSIAAVVASIDDSFAAYPASMQLQESKKEMITDLKAMTIERLQAYEKVNGKGKFPARIIMFRDGVSEGQFLTVLRSELPQVREACSRVAQNYKPSISYIIAGKRHNTRFYPTDAEGTDERNNGNPKCGMVVDIGVTGVYTFDFFLQSHVGLKGHARPTHYTVITDENKFSADDLQRLCHELSHTFVRATRGVSLIPPAYYADLACERGRCYLFESLNADGGSTTGTMDSSKAEAAVYADAVKAWGQGPSTRVRDRMYYI